MAKKAAKAPKQPPRREFSTVGPKLVSKSPLKILLDSENPRLTPEEQGGEQHELLEVLNQRFKLLELGRSIATSGYMTFDPLVGLQEKGQTIVLEGNRRIAALQLLLNPDLAPQRHKAAWTGLSEEMSRDSKKSIEKVDIMTFSSRDEADVAAYIGFRHVTSVLKWPALEKAAYIARLVEKQEWTYEEVAQRLGSYPRHIERHYVAYRLVQQAVSDEVDGFENLEQSFGVLLRALQAGGLSEFLGINYPGMPSKSKRPVPDDKFEQFENFVQWTFGTDEDEPVLQDSRQLTKWSKILQSAAAYRYLKSTSNPRFERAWQKSGGEADSLIEALFGAADRLEESVPLVAEHAEEDEIVEAVDQCARFMGKILEQFPEIAKNRGFKQGK